MSAAFVLTLFFAAQSPGAAGEGVAKDASAEAAAAAAASSAASSSSPDEAADAAREQEAASLGVEALDEQGRAYEARRAKLAKWAQPDAVLPSEETLRDVLALDNLHPDTLRTKANAVRVELMELERAPPPPPPPADAGATVDGGTGEPVIEVPPAQNPTVIAHIAALKAELLLLARLQTEARKAAEAEFQRLREEEEAARRRAHREAEEAAAAKAKALASAAQAKTKLIGTLYARVAELEDAKLSIANARSSLHEESAADLERVQLAAQAASQAVDDGRSAEKGALKTDQTFDGVIAKQRKALEEVRGAIEMRAEAPAEVEAAAALLGTADIDSLSASAAIAGQDDPDVVAALDELKAATTSLDEVAQLLSIESDERWFQVAEGRLKVAKIYNEARLVLIGRVSEDKYDALHGFTESGLDNLEIAVEQVYTSFRFHNVKRVHDVIHLPDLFDDTLATGNLLMALLRGGLLLAAAVWLWRRGPSFFSRIRKAALASARNSKSARLYDALFSIAEEVGPKLFIIVVALWEHAVWSGVGPEPEIGVVVEVLVWVLGYQLSARLLHMLILRLARRRHSLTVPQKLRILRSVRVGLRYGVITAFVLGVTRQFVGAGVLFSAARTLALIGGLPVAFLLIQRWREDITNAYLKGWPDTRLATIVESTKDQWYGFFLATAAFGFVAGKGVVGLSRDFILGFEQTRQALAYIFRLRIERQAKKGGGGQANIDALPDRVKEVFSDAPALDDRNLVDRFSALEKLKQRIERDDAHGGGLVIHGGYGMGRTTWLKKLERSLDSETKIALFSPSFRCTTKEALFDELAAAAGLEEEGASLDPATLGRKLIDMRMRAFIIDGLEWLFLRDLNGYAAVDALFDLVQRTRKQVLWVLSAPTGTYQYLCRTRRIDSYVSSTIEITRWSEEEIRDLIRGRIRRSGIEVSFEELLARDVEGAREPTQIVETEDGYIRLLWNFAEGNPRVAQHFWLRSLVPADEEDKYNVRLYDAPAADDLEGLLEGERFFLAAFVLHRALAAEEVARVCHAPLALADAHIDRGLELGLYRPLAGGDDVYTISLPWWEAALRYLRRKNLI